MNASCATWSEGRRRRGSRRRRGRSDEDALVEDAERRGRRKAKAMRELLHFAIVVGGLSIFLPGIAWIVGLIWGLSIAHDVVNDLIEPELRRRWIDREVHRELDRTVRAERDRIQGDHSRDLEALAAGVAKEIRDPLASAKDLVSQMGEDPKADHNVSHANVALRELERVEASISHLLQFARDEQLQLVPTALSEVLLASAGALREQAHDRGVVLAPVLDAEGWIDADPKPLAQAIANLIAQALDAVDGERDPRVDLSCGENLAGTAVWLQIVDNGALAADERVDDERPFRDAGDEDPRLGLAYAKKVIEALGGAIELEVEPGRGSRVVVTFPKRANDEGNRA